MYLPNANKTSKELTVKSRLKDRQKTGRKRDRQQYTLPTEYPEMCQRH